MESLSTDRRTSSPVRMPVTMSVELAHDELGEAFEADAVNVSAGGLGIRSAMLPDIGQRMTCRFAMPELDGPCEAEGEVVWASDTGADAGEFGIRFDTLEPRVGVALARWVASLEDTPPSSSAKKPSRSVRVQLDGVASPIDAEISLRSTDMLRVEQPLPFLTIGTGAIVMNGKATVGGERRVLRSVELRVENDVPRLVLELASTPSATSESTVSDEPLDDLLARPARDAEQVAARASEEDEARAPDDAVDDSSDGPIEAHVTPVAARVAEPMVARPRARRDDEARAVRLDSSDREISVDALIASASAPADPDEEPTLGERARALAAAAGPALARMLSALRAGWAVLVATTGPRARVAAAAIARALKAMADSLRERAPAALQRLVGRAPKRRTTAPPPPGREPTAARRSQTRAEPAPSPAVVRRVSPRAVVAGVLTLAAIAIVVRALASDDASAEDVPVHTSSALEAETPGASSEVAAPLAPTTASPAAASAAETDSSASETPTVASPTVTEPVALTLPGTMPEPTSEAGRIPAPTFPGVGEGASPEASTEAAAPTIDDDGDLLFGAADVPHGRTTTLRMSLPVTAIEGESDSTGFTVTFHGALSLDRAGPIAAANPSVERAAILNRGDHAVLTVRFVAGRTPAYRVEATGSTATVTIGR